MRPRRKQIMPVRCIRCKHRKAHLRSKRKWEFSKKLAAWAVAISTLAIASSFVLSFIEREPVQDVTNTVVTVCVGYLVTYALKSLAEKASRNKYNLDVDGNPRTPYDGDAADGTEGDTV